MDYEIETAELQVNDVPVTVAGDAHVGESFAYSADRIDRLMADHGTFAWEARGYEPDGLLNEVDGHAYDGIVALNEGMRTLEADGRAAENAMNSFDAYVLAVDDLALDHFDVAWGPDSHHAIPYATGLAGALVLAGDAGYILSAASGDDDIRDAVRSGLSNVRRQLQGGEYEEVDGLSRRQYLRAGAAAAVGGTAAWVGGAFDPGDDGPAAGWTYTDMRDALTAAGIDRITRADDDPLLMLCGRAHVDGIARYLEEPDHRKERLERYGPVLDAVLESDTRMARWAAQDGGWTRTDVLDLHP